VPLDRYQLALDTMIGDIVQLELLAAEHAAEAKTSGETDEGSAADIRARCVAAEASVIAKMTKRVMRADLAVREPRMSLTERKGVIDFRFNQAIAAARRRLQSESKAS